MRSIRLLCVSLARSDAGGSALDWMRSPLIDLGDWADTVRELQARDNKHKK